MNGIVLLVFCKTHIYNTYTVTATGAGRLISNLSLAMMSSLPEKHTQPMPITTTSPTVAGSQILREIFMFVKIPPDQKREKSRRRDLLSFYQHQAPLQHIKDDSTERFGSEGR